MVAFSNVDVALPVDDDDGDGFTSDVDCDDNDDTVYPGAPELCDGKDNDCNTSVDDGLTFVRTILILMAMGLVMLRVLEKVCVKTSRRKGY